MPKISIEELNHLKRASGMARQFQWEAVIDTTARTNRILLNRLENIRHYADRENPNGEEILLLVKEIEYKMTQLLQDLEEEHKP